MSPSLQIMFLIADSVVCEQWLRLFAGNSVGTAVTYPLCGVLIARLGWSSAFYVPGAIGLLWCVCWWLLVFDSPDKHPRISEHEKTYIRTAVAPTLAAKQVWSTQLNFIPTTVTFVIYIHL